MQNFRLFIALSLSLFLSKQSPAQQADELIGNWKIIKVEMQSNADPEEKKGLAMAKQIFLQSAFHFKTSNLFSFDCPNKELAIKNGIWHFNTNKKFIAVTGKTPKGGSDNLMGMFVKKQADNYLFLMEETPLVLTVAKTN